MKVLTYINTERKKPNQPKHHFIWYLLSGVVTLLSFGIMGKFVYANWETIKQLRGQIHIAPLLLTFPVFCLTQILASFAWARMMNSISNPLPMSEHFKIYIVTVFARRLPGSLWYVVGRIAGYERLGISKRITLFGNVIESILILWSGMIVTSFMALFLPGPVQRQIPLFLIGIALSAVLIHPRVLDYVLRKIGSEEHYQRLSFQMIFVSLLLYVFIWLLGSIILILCVTALYPVPVGLWPVFVEAWSLAGVAGMLILLLPTGLGLNEATQILVLSSYIPSSIAVMGAILVRILMMFYEFMLAILMIVFYKISPPKQENVQISETLSK